MMNLTPSSSDHAPVALATDNCPRLLLVDDEPRLLFVARLPLEE